MGLACAGVAEEEHVVGLRAEVVNARLLAHLLVLDALRQGPHLLLHRPGREGRNRRRCSCKLCSLQLGVRVLQVVSCSLQLGVLVLRVVSFLECTSTQRLNYFEVSFS